MKQSEDQNTITFPILKAVESDVCDGCYFKGARVFCNLAQCYQGERKDGKSVIFVEAENEKT